MSRRRFRAVLSAALVAPLTAACIPMAESAVTEETEVLRLNFSQNREHPVARALFEAAQEFEERTDGAYELEIYTDDTLVAQPAAIEQVQAGAIDFAVVSGSLMENHVEEFAVMNLPYVFESAEHQRRVLNDDDALGELYSKLEPHQLEVAQSFFGGVRNLYSSTGPVSGPQDLAGQKIRVIASDTNLATVDLMGGVGTPMGQGEMFTAIQSGVLDGAENNEIMFSYLSHYEVAPHYSLSEHLMIPDYLVTHPQVWDRLDPEAGQILEEILGESDERVLELFDEETAEAVTEAEDAGAQFHDVDQSAFRDAVRPLHREARENALMDEVYRSIEASGDE